MSTKKETKVNGVICISRREWDLRLKIELLEAIEVHISKCNREREQLLNNLCRDENGNYATDWDKMYATQAEAQLMLQLMLEELAEKI